MKREPRPERLEAASRTLRGRLLGLDADELDRLHDLLERVLELEVLDRTTLQELEAVLLP